MSADALTSDPELVQGLQERTARALPTTHVENVAGWWLRHSPGCSWWANTVLPHGAADPDDMARRVAAAEEFYASHAVTARFQISPGACPDGLDAVLAERGYRRASEISLRVAATKLVLDHVSPTGLRFRWDDRPTRAWFDVWYAVQGDGVDPSSEWEMLHRVALPSGYVSAVDSAGDVVGVGRTVADTGFAGVFGMATLPSVRGRGTGRQVLAALARWADEHAVDRMYLQVERDNLAAERLYRGAGFTEVCGYHYRTGQ